MMYKLNGPKFKTTLLLGVILLLLATMLSCAGDPIVDPRNVDEEDEDTTDENEEDPSGLSSTWPHQPTSKTRVV